MLVKPQEILKLKLVYKVFKSKMQCKEPSSRCLTVRHDIMAKKVICDLPRYSLMTRDLKSPLSLLSCTLTCTRLADHSKDPSSFCFCSDILFFNYQKDKVKGHLFQLFLSELCKLHILVVSSKSYTASTACKNLKALPLWARCSAGIHPK